MHKIKIGNSRRSLPSNWNEVSPDQLKEIIRAKFNPHLDAAAVVGVILIRLLHIPLGIFKRIGEDEKYDLVRLLDFIFKEPSPIAILKEFRLRGRKYFVPATKLEFSSVIEYVFAEQFYEQFRANPNDTEALDKLVACLCRPRKSLWLRMLYKLGIKENDGDVREKFDTAKMEKRAKKFAKLKPDVKYTILFFFIGCYEAISKDYAVLYEKEEDAAQDEVQPERKPGAVIWMQLLYKLAESGIFGNLDNVYYSPLHTILNYMANKRMEFLENEKNKKQDAPTGY